MTDRLWHGSPHNVAELVPNRHVTQDLPKAFIWRFMQQVTGIWQSALSWEA